MTHGDDGAVAELLARPVWAVVGLTGNQARASYGVAAFLQRQGKRIVPVNPGGRPVLGEPGYADLADIPFAVDVVDIFRRSEAVGRHVDQAIEIAAGGVWLQLGVVDAAAARRAATAGLQVVMDRCPVIDWPRLGPDRVSRRPAG